MSWQNKRLDFEGRIITASVFCDVDYDLVDGAYASKMDCVSSNCSVFVRVPALSKSNPTGFTGAYKPPIPKKEAWHLDGIGPFLAIKFVKTVFDSPRDDALLSNGFSVTRLIDRLSSSFSANAVCLSLVTVSFLMFDLLPRGTEMSKAQYLAIDAINRECFRADESGRRVPASKRCAPGSFVVGMF